MFDIQSHTYWHPNFKVEQRRLSATTYRTFATMQFVKPRMVLKEKLGIEARFGGFLSAARKALIPFNVFLAGDVFGYICWNRDDTNNARMTAGWARSPWRTKSQTVSAREIDTVDLPVAGWAREPIERRHGVHPFICLTPSRDHASQGTRDAKRSVLAREAATPARRVRLRTGVATKTRGNNTVRETSAANLPDNRHQ